MEQHIDLLLDKDIQCFHENINYSFKDREILIKALKHRSMLVELNEDRIESNERLEFLGDSILNFSVTEFLYSYYPDLEEGELSKMKSVIISGDNLVQIAEKINLGHFFILSEAEEKAGGRHKKSLLEDTFEALIGAIYIDGGLDSAQNFVKKFVLNNIEETLSNIETKNYKSLLLEYVQDLKLPFPTYSIISENGPEHNKLFTVAVYVVEQEIARGSAYSRKKAEQLASRNALELIHNEEVTLSFDKSEI